MKVEINKSLCIGCGLCVTTCPDVFELKEEKANIKTKNLSKTKCNIIEVAESCPSEAIIVKN